MDDFVAITDVGPRDGLQNQSRILELDQRQQLVEALGRSGLQHIEFGSFVSPKAVPAMAGTDQLAASLALGPEVELIALVPNMKGYTLARDAGVRTVTMVVYASEGMAQRNVNMTREQADQNAHAILAQAKQDGVEVITTIAVGFRCPYDGDVDPCIVEKIVDQYMATHSKRVIVADTIGAANPRQVSQLCRSLVTQHGSARLGMHFHDTRSMGVANVYAAVEAGIRQFDASIAGLGGCPFAKGASGNVATEEVVSLLHQMGMRTGIDMPALLAASRLTEELVGVPANVKSKNWLKQYYA